MTISPQMIENLKAAKHYFAAGAVAASIGGARFYGCHFGMRSTRDASQAEFFRGYDAAQPAKRTCRHCDRAPMPGYGNCLPCAEEVGGDY